MVSINCAILRSRKDSTTLFLWRMSDVFVVSHQLKMAIKTLFISGAGMARLVLFDQVMAHSNSVTKHLLTSLELMCHYNVFVTNSINLYLIVVNNTVYFNIIWYTICRKHFVVLCIMLWLLFIFSMSCLLTYVSACINVSIAYFTLSEHKRNISCDIDIMIWSAAKEPFRAWDTGHKKQFAWINWHFKMASYVTAHKPNWQQEKWNRSLLALSFITLNGRTCRCKVSLPYFEWTHAKHQLEHVLN